MNRRTFLRYTGLAALFTQLPKIELDLVPLPDIEVREGFFLKSSQYIGVSDHVARPVLLIFRRDVSDFYQPIKVL